MCEASAKRNCKYCKKKLNKIDSSWTWTNVCFSCERKGKMTEADKRRRAKPNRTFSVDYPEDADF